MTFGPELNIFTKYSSQRDEVIKSIIYIQASCILFDRTMATFVPPLSYDRMMNHWDNLFNETIDNKRVIILWLCEVANRSSCPPNPATIMPFENTTWPVLEGGLEVGGVVSLFLPHWETGPFRARVQNLFVHPFHRRKGIARALLTELERQALQLDKWSLMLDTAAGTPAEKMYEALGWNRMGVVEKYGYRRAENGEGLVLSDEVWFWKNLK